MRQIAATGGKCRNLDWAGWIGGETWQAGLELLLQEVPWLFLSS